MTEELNIEGMSVSPSVMEKIISVAAREISGVACIGSDARTSLRSRLRSKPSGSEIETEMTADGKIYVTLHMEVEYGSVIPDIAAQVREAVADALRIQVGVDVAGVDIYVDGIQFN